MLSFLFMYGLKDVVKLDKVIRRNQSVMNPEMFKEVEKPESRLKQIGREFCNDP